MLIEHKSITRTSSFSYLIVEDNVEDDYEPCEMRNIW